MDDTVSLLAVGEAMVDVVVSVAGATSGPTHRPIRLQAGGTPVNAALAARSLGASAAVIAHVGDDAGAAVIRHDLASSGVLALLTVDPDRPTGVFVDVGGIVVADRGANDGLAPGDLANRPVHDALLVSGYSFRNATASAAHHALTTSTARWRAADVGGAPADADTEGANVLLGTWEELGGSEQEDAATLALRLARRFEVVVVKLGADGAIVATAARAIHRSPAVRESEGAVGAGDALDAGVLVGLTRGLEPAAALELGLEAAASHIRAHSLVTRR